MGMSNEKDKAKAKPPAAKYMMHVCEAGVAASVGYLLYCVWLFAQTGAALLAIAAFAAFVMYYRSHYDEEHARRIAAEMQGMPVKRKDGALVVRKQSEEPDDEDDDD